MYSILKILLLVVTFEFCNNQKLEIKNLNEDPILLLELNKCKIQTGNIRIIHPINLTNLELTINSINKLEINKIGDKLELHKLMEQKIKNLVNNFQQIKPINHKRHKRWDSLGSAWKWLAGNPDAEDLRIINSTMNALISENNQQWKINDQVNKRIQLITDAVNNALRNATTANKIILSEIEMLATIVNIDTINVLLEDIQDAIVKTKLQLTSNRILSLKEIISIKDLLIDQGVNITLPDEALQYVIPKIVVNQETLLYILQVPKLEDEESTAIMIVPLVVNNTIINSYPQHVIKSKQKLFTSLNHADFVQKHSRIQEFRDNCIKPLMMGTDSQCNVTTELETTIRYISEDKLLVNNAKEGNLSSNCGPNHRTFQ